MKSCANNRIGLSMKFEKKNGTTVMKNKLHRAFAMRTKWVKKINELCTLQKKRRTDLFSMLGSFFVLKNCSSWQELDQSENCILCRMYENAIKKQV